MSILQLQQVNMVLSVGQKRNGKTAKQTVLFLPCHSFRMNNTISQHDDDDNDRKEKHIKWMRGHTFSAFNAFYKQHRTCTLSVAHLNFVFVFGIPTTRFYFI